MKGYCKCGAVIDEVTFTQFGMCDECRAYNKGYQDALFDCSNDDNDGDHEPYRMEDDYD